MRDVQLPNGTRVAALGQLAPDDLAAVDAEFPPPGRRKRLEML